MLKTPEFHTIYDPIVTESKGMLKTPEFHATYDPIATESKGMQKNSRFSRKLKQSINECSHDLLL